MIPDRESACRDAAGFDAEVLSPLRVRSLKFVEKQAGTILISCI